MPRAFPALWKTLRVRDHLTLLLTGDAMTEDQAFVSFGRVLDGEADPAALGAALALIQARGPTVDELVGAARAMRERAARVPYEAAPGEALIDTCGTGGAPKTFNVSTAAALVVAGARGALRVRVAKHGNRSRSGRGSAEVLERLGVNVAASPEAQALCLERAGVCFCFAIHHHPAAKHAAGVRAALPFPTIFNLLGPLTNPAGARRQVLGVFERRYVEPMARALLRLGSERAMVVHGGDGMDEITTTAGTFCAEVEGGAVTAREIDAAAWGVPRASPESLVARDLDHAVGVVRGVLEGEAGPARDIVAVNAAAALWVAGAAPSIPAGLALARESIDSGAAAGALLALAEASREP